MNDLDLRLALHRDADLVGEPSPHLLDDLARRRQHQRRQSAGILAAAAAVVLVGAGIPVVSSLALRSHTAPATQQTLAPTPPVSEESTPTTPPAATATAPASQSTPPLVGATPVNAEPGPSLTLAPASATASCSYSMEDVIPSSRTVAFGSTVTVRLPSSLSGGPGFHAELQPEPAIGTRSSADPAIGMTMTGGAGGTYRVTIPDTPALRQIPGGLPATLVLGPLSSPLEGVSAGEDCRLLLTVTSSGAQALTFAPRGFLGVDLPAVSVPAGGRLTMTLPSNSVLHSVGVGTLRDLSIALFMGDEGGDVLSSNVDVSADGTTAVMHVPADAPPGKHSLEVMGHSAGLYSSVTVTTNR